MESLIFVKKEHSNANSQIVKVKFNIENEFPLKAYNVPSISDSAVCRGAVTR